MDVFPLPLGVALLAVLLATVTDLRAFRIYNALTLPLLVSGLLYHGFSGEPGALANSFYGAAFGFVSLLGFYALGGMGGGDVKLMAGIGAWLGMPLTFWVFIAAALAAGCYSLVLICSGGRVRETWVRLQLIWFRVSAIGRHLGGEDRIEAEVTRADRRQRLIPFAAMMMVGLVVVTVLVKYRAASALAAHP